MLSLPTLLLGMAAGLCMGAALAMLDGAEAERVLMALYLAGGVAATAAVLYVVGWVLEA